MLLSGEVRELHHDWRTDGKYLIDMLLLEEFLHTNGYYTLPAVATIIGHDDYLVRTLANLILEDNQVFATTSHYGEDPVASSLQCLDDRQHWSHTETTTGTYYCTVFLYACGVTQRTNHVGHEVTLIQSA